MKINNQLISKGFITAGLMNLTVLLFSKFFTNDAIPRFDPMVMSNFGLLMIVIWGLAYMSVAKRFNEVKWLIAVFSVEKLVYGSLWIKWLLNNDLSKVYEADVLAGAFYSVYGINDWLFCGFFMIAFLKVHKEE